MLCKHPFNYEASLSSKALRSAELTKAKEWHIRNSVKYHNESEAKGQLLCKHDFTDEA